MATKSTAAKSAPAKTPVSAVKHKDQRKNIPTEELRDFVSDDERAPKKQLYPRDPSLDPQLVWKGKDEQDAADLHSDGRSAGLHGFKHRAARRAQAGGEAMHLRGLAGTVHALEGDE